MNVFLVIYVLGEVALSGGPFPYETHFALIECDRQREEFAQDFKSPEMAKLITEFSTENPDHAFTPNDVTLECIVADKAPAIDNPVFLYRGIK